MAEGRVALSVKALAKADRPQSCLIVPNRASNFKKTHRPPNLMKTKSNLVTLLAGVAIGAAAVLSIAAVQTDASSCGRFQLLASENNLFKIDTATGQVWQTWVNSPSRDFMRPNIKTSEPAVTNPPPKLEKGAEK
jgi:hypothetical protein